MTLVEVMIALALTGLTVGGIVSGYIYCSTATAKDALYMAANTRASERMEAARAAVWDTTYNGVDQLVASNFPDLIVALNKDGTNDEITTATVKTTITQISTNPSVRDIRVDCIWLFQGTQITNTIETDRAPNQ